MASQKQQTETGFGISTAVEGTPARPGRRLGLRIEELEARIAPNGDIGGDPSDFVPPPPDEPPPTLP